MLIFKGHVPRQALPGVFEYSRPTVYPSKSTPSLWDLADSCCLCASVGGAEPTDLALAVWPARRGVRLRIIDRSTEVGTTPRGMAVQASTRWSGPGGPVWSRRGIVSKVSICGRGAGRRSTCRMRADTWGRARCADPLNQEADCQRSLEAGFDDHLVKPVDLDRLIALAEQIGECERCARQSVERGAPSIRQAAPLLRLTAASPVATLIVRGKLHVPQTATRLLDEHAL